MKESLALYFEAGKPARLVRHVLEVTDDNGRTWCRESVPSTQASPRQGSFRHGRGLRVWCLLLLRIRLAGAKLADRPLLEGGKSSVASSMDYLVVKQDNWLHEILRLRADDHPDQRLRRWLIVKNSKMTTQKDGPVRIFAGQGARALRPENIIIYLNEEPVSEGNLARLERELAVALGEEPWSKQGTRKNGTLPGDGTLLVGRDQELEQMHRAAESAVCRLLQIIAPGGVGKTTLARCWLDDAELHEQRGWSRVLAWSFYRQGFTSDAVQPLWPFRQALADFLEVTLPRAATAKEIADLLLAGFSRQPTLLILDGVETVLHGPGTERAGWLRDEMLPALLQGIGQAEQGFCLLTSRVAVADLQEVEAMRQLALPPLSSGDTRHLLRKLEVQGLSRDLQAAVEFTQGHPLLIRLLASRYHLSDYQGKSAPDGLRRLLDELRNLRWWTDSWREDDQAMTRMLRSYANQLVGTSELVLLQLAAMFDRLPDEDALWSLVTDLTKLGSDFVICRNLSVEQWLNTASRLRQCGLAFAGNGLVIEMHPVVQGFFAKLLREGDPTTYRAVHRLLYEHFRAVPEKELPDTMEEMQPLLRATYHGCQAGMYRRVYDEVSWPRTSRGLETYMLIHLGAIQETLAIISCFTTRGWHFPADSDLGPEARGALLIVVASCERLRERLDVAISLLRRAVRLLSRGENALLLFAAYAHLVRLATMRGRLRLGLITCLQIKWMARKRSQAFAISPQTVREQDFAAYNCVNLACLLLVVGRKKDGEEMVARALALVRLDDPGLILLPSLSAPFHAFWLLETGQNAVLLQAIEAGQTDFNVRLYEFNNSAALIKGLAWTRQAIDTGQPPDAAHLAKTQGMLDEAVQVARNFGRWQLLADALLARARWLSHFGNREDFLRDLNQGREISRQYGFMLILTDLILLETNHWLRAGDVSQAGRAFKEAAALVKKHGYKLREPMIADLALRLKQPGQGKKKRTSG